MATKIFKTLQEQIDILKSRGLIIPEEDTSMAKEFLLQNNYYRISGYTLTLRKNDIFYSDVTIRDVIEIYNFDHELRSVLLEHLDTIEVKIKSVYAYDFSEKYGGMGYRNSINFTNNKDYLDIVGKADSQKEKNLSDEAYIQHYVNDLQEEMPLWVWVDLLTFSNISKLYKITKPEMQIRIARDMGIATPNDEKTISLLEEFLRELSILRNFCAHGRRLYNRLFVRKPSLNKKEKQLLITGENGIDNAHLYGFVIIMRRILSSDQFGKLKESIKTLTEKYPFVDMRHYGFREDWYQVL